ncbi:DNA-3-methyladenine glycosylase 1 [Pyrus x bretschneideri]|uniref:DNA-3-methyladenine glycosylase 1 n=1 Tax=Pyrus x bretschneideri TaxID=225117 RepID=UPI00202EA568|nr:DNA-3-methyladenine glycosylase 1 [Pyrus x bretschneideri]
MAKRAKPQIQNQISENPSISSKIPFRPRKILKVSNTPASAKPSPSSPALPKALIPLTSQTEINLALQHLRSSDPNLRALIDSYTPPSFDSSRPPFISLARSILYQQLATKAAQSIYTRFISLCGGEASVVADVVLSLSAQQLRTIGISGRKASYLHDLAEKYSDGTLSDSSILEMDDEALLRMLTLVKGIGVWSVHMFMIFSLRRPDVLPVGDLGVRKGVKLLYGLKELPKPLEMDELCEKWRPYRSVGSWYMWRYMEAKGVL